MLDEPFMSSVKKLKKQRADVDKDEVKLKSGDSKIPIGSQGEKGDSEDIELMKNESKRFNRQKKKARVQLWELSNNLKMEVYEDERKWIKFKEENGIDRSFDESESEHDSCEDVAVNSSDYRSLDQTEARGGTRFAR